MPSYPSLTPEMLAEYDRAINGRLTPPETARKKTQKNYKTDMPEEHVRWNESARITDVQVTETISGAGDNHDLYAVKFEITGTKGSGTLVGQQLTFLGRINSVAFEAGDKDNGQFKMSRGTLIRLAQLVRAAGFQVKGGLSSAQMAAFYPVNGASPLVGKEVYIEIHQKESDAAPTGWDEEVSNIFPLAVNAASAEV